VVSVAIVGLDGAGKTTITRRLVERLPQQTVYLYMGMNPDSSNVALPSTRLVHALKKRGSGGKAGAPVSLHSITERRRKRGRVWSTLRLVNRLAEETVRHGLGAWHQWRGRLVVTDRDFLIDYSVAAKPPLAITDRIHLFVLAKLLPKPDLVVWLDAPPDVLYGRKPEVPIAYLERRRDGIGRLGSTFRRFEVVDADRPLDEVYRSVEILVESACQGRRVKRRKRGPMS
jgi:thymidylate kinase